MLLQIPSLQVSKGAPRACKSIRVAMHLFHLKPWATRTGCKFFVNYLTFIFHCSAEHFWPSYLNMTMTHVGFFLFSRYSILAKSKMRVSNHVVVLSDGFSLSVESSIETRSLFLPHHLIYSRSVDRKCFRRLNNWSTSSFKVWLTCLTMSSLERSLYRECLPVLNFL